MKPIRPDGDPPPHKVSIDFMQPDEAEAVVACFHEVYGPNYPIDTFNDPEKLRKANASRDTVSIVARTDRGEVVGHTAMFRSTPHPGVYEAGAGLVVPAYRSTEHILTRMVRFGHQQGRQLKIDGLFGEMVCNHIISQKMGAGQGWIPCALEVDLMPATAYSQEKSAEGRVSTLIGFTTVCQRRHQIFLPPDYETELRDLYEHLDDARTLKIAYKDWPEGLETRIDLQVFEFAQVARLAVPTLGDDFEACLDQSLQAAGSPKTAVWQVWLNLGQPWVHRAVAILRRKGFFFGGLLPRWFDDDGLLMQKVQTPPCWDEIQLASKRARQLANWVRKDWQKSE